MVCVENFGRKGTCGFEQTPNDHQDVIGTKADQEDHDRTEDQLLDLKFFPALGTLALPNHFKNSTVGKQEQEDREEETSKESIIINTVLPVFDGVVFKTDNMAVWVLADLPVLKEDIAGH